VTLEKLVLACYKREIVVVQGTETTKQKRRTYKELLEQLNKAKVAGIVVAIR
jgi:fructose-1-phosphate kinase PfkB-like protein